MGGFMQPQGHVQLLVNMIDYGMEPQAAIDAPRFCIDGANTDDETVQPKVFLEEGYSVAAAEQLRCMGHVIEDREAIKTFCSDNDLDLYNVNHLLGLYQGNTAQPLHVNHWQPQHLFLFLKRHGGDGELVGVLGGPGKGRSKAESGVNHFITHVAAHRSDMPFTEKNRDKLQQLLVGTYRSHNVPSNNFMGWGLAFPNTNGYAPSEFLDSWFATTQYWATEQAMLCP